MIRDDLYEEAVELATRTQRISITNLQRKLRIGYNRAAAIVEDMEKDGVISRCDKTGIRKVLLMPG